MVTGEDILKADYKSLPISGSFKRFFTEHKLPNLEALLCYGSKELMEMKWFNAHTLRELIVILEDNDLMAKLK